MAAEVDPVAALRAAFVRIAATRMAGLPLLNPRLTVATLGFVPWQGEGEDAQVGILVTPWSINLVAVSAQAESLRLAVDTRRRWRFPSGEYELMGGEEPECGCFQFCSLFSPVLEFADQAAAADTARAAMAALFAAAGHDDREAARLAGRSVLNAPSSRRGFLFGAFAAPKA